MNTLNQDAEKMSTLDSDELIDKMNTILAECQAEACDEPIGEAERPDDDEEGREQIMPQCESTPMTKPTPLRRSKRDLTATNDKIKKHSS